MNIQHIQWSLKKTDLLFFLRSYWLWPSARHLKEVTVTAFKWRSLEKWLADGQGSDVTWSDVTRNFWNFFSLFFGILGNFKRFHEKKISKILRCDVTSEVTGRWPRKWRHLKWPSFEKSDVTSFKWRADGQSQCKIKKVLQKLAYIFSQNKLAILTRVGNTDYQYGNITFDNDFWTHYTIT